MKDLEQCRDFFNDSPRLFGMGYGRLLAAGIFFTLGLSTVAFLLHQRKSAASLQSSRQSSFSSSTIFPAFELFLYLLVFVNAFTGVLILSTDYHVGGEWTTSSFLFTAAITMQHMVTEGMAFMLMQKGCGLYAFKRAGYFAMLWGGVTYALLVYTSFRQKGAFGVFSAWNSMLLVFYLSLWFTPMDYLFRRPAAVLFAKLFSVYHGLTFALFIYEFFFTNDSVACTFFFDFIFVEPVLQPIFAYYILLEDCRWWQGRGRFSKAASMSAQHTTSPLHGFDVSLQSATALARVVDHMGGAATATLISFSQISYDKRNLIGHGSFSKVYKGKYKAKECAIKLVFTMDLTEEDICRVAAEATILSSVRSINVVDIFGVTVLPPSVCIVLELCAYGSLSDVLRHPKALTLTFQDQLFLCLGCARGVAALHALSDSIVHRDIKSFNFLVDHQLNAKLADLELGANTDSIHEIKNIDDNSLFDQDFLANWMAPEVLLQCPYTQASDIYSLALVIWEIFSKEMPYSEKNNASTRDAIVNNYRPDINHIGFQHCPGGVIQSLIDAGWSDDPLVRPVASDFVSVIESIWLTHGIQRISILEVKSEDIMNKLLIADAVMARHANSKGDLFVKPVAQGDNGRLMTIVPLFEVFEAIEKNDVWKIVRNLGESAMIVSGTSPHMFLQCSLEWEQLTGYLSENLFGYTMKDLLSHDKSWESGKEVDVGLETYNSFLSSIQTTSSGHCVITLATPIGTEVTISLHASPIYKSQYQRNASDDNVSSSSSWSGAVPYARTIAFYKFTASVLTQVVSDEDALAEDDGILFKILRKLSVDSGSLSRSNSFFSMNKGNGRSFKGSRRRGYPNGSSRSGSRESRASGWMTNRSDSNTNSSYWGEHKDRDREAFGSGARSISGECNIDTVHEAPALTSRSSEVELSNLV